ncbi:hypothetical protein [Lonepinella sp. BR2474]|uniref:hypothetical protein n=1 Tax=unclassified Lonepinella TaxID=2642006 RepID=UPI003F6E05BA
MKKYQTKKLESSQLEALLNFVDKNTDYTEVTGETKEEFLTHFFGFNPLDVDTKEMGYEESYKKTVCI